MMYSGIKAVFRAFCLAMLQITHEDKCTQLLTHEDVDTIPPDCEVFMTFEIRHRKADDEPE